MTISKETKTLNMPWEREFGYAQAVRVGDTIYLAGQVSHDEKGNFVGVGEMETQMRQAYANVARVLGEYGASMENVVDEILFVTNMETAFTARVNCREDVFGGFPALASTIVQIERLGFPELLVEIRCVAKV
ncbi:MAG TPA: RidA family protein [Pyrinomonadaceae bacterium]|jgi:enamine deaminase RidA (YjgF/YER057c/UK114 family)